MEISVKELEKNLFNSGNKLLNPPSTVTELLNLLDVVENLLAQVDQSPSESMKEALVPSTKALIAEQFVRHTDVDIRVAVASCISEITRITAPETPYADDQMKEVFQLIVSCFEKLDDRKSRSYARRISILETVAKVRSCVVMLDLECDELIIEMFRHFFRTIRIYHRDTVFSSMETIMSLVLEESEDISVDLLSVILDVLIKEKKEVLAIACHLGEKVIVNCAGKLKPYLLPAVRSTGASLGDFSKAVADVYQVGDEAAEPTDGDASNTNLVDDNNLTAPSSEKAVEVAMETLEGAPPSEEVGPSTVESSKAAVSNGILQKDNEDSSAPKDNSKEAVNDTQDEKGGPSKSIADRERTKEPAKSKTKSKKSSKRKGKKSNSSKSSEYRMSNRVTEVISAPEHQDDAMDVDNVQREDPAVDDFDAADNEKSSDVPLLSPKASDSKCADIHLPSPSISLADETGSEKAAQGKATKDPIREGEKIHDVDPGKESDHKKDSEEAIGSKSNLNKQDSKNSSSASDPEDPEPDSANGKMKEDDNMYELDEKLAKDLAQEIEVGSQLANKEKRGQAKAISGKGHKKTPAKDEKKNAVVSPQSTPKAIKSESDLEEASRPSSKRKRLSKEIAPRTKVYGLELVGATVKVWWPDDKKYYKGVIDSFDATKKKHKILYSDGEIEVLNLKEEKWLLVNHSKVCADILLSSRTGSLSDETRSEKAGQGMTKDDPIQEGETAHKVDPGKESGIKKDSEEATGPKSNLNKHDSENPSSVSGQVESQPDSADDTKKETEVGSQLDDKEKSGSVKVTAGKGHKKTQAKDKKKKAVALSKSTPKATKRESDVEETLRSSSKRKRLSEEKAPRTKVYGLELVGETVKVWWPDDKKYYEGVIDSFDADKKKHKIVYTDGEIEVLDLKKEKWLLLVDHSKGHDSDGESHDDSADEIPKGKRVKTSSAKQGKIRSPGKKSSGKSNATPKTGSKKMIDSKTAGNAEEESTKKDTSKSAKKSNDDDTDTRKGSGNSKSKQDTVKGGAKSKGKSPNSVDNSMQAVTSTEDEESEDESLEPEKSPEKSKIKSQSTPKSQKRSKKRK